MSLAGTAGRTEATIDLTEILLIVGGVILLVYVAKKGFASAGSGITSAVQTVANGICHLIENAPPGGGGTVVGDTSATANQLAAQSLILQGLQPGTVDDGLTVPGSGLTIGEMRQMYGDHQTAILINSSIQQGLACCPVANGSSQAGGQGGLTANCPENGLCCFACCC